MSDVEAKSKREAKADSPAAVWSPEPAPRETPRRRLRILPFVITLATIAVAGALGWAMWNAYMGAPWTRDGTVRAYVVTMAVEVSGYIVELPVADNQFVHKGDLLMVIDPTNYKIAVSLAEAAVQQAQANLDQARVNLERTEIRSPVNGYVTNLLAQLGDYANVGQNEISVVDADSFWVDGYFEETNLEPIQVGDPAEIKLMGYSQIVRGHVGSIARGINVANAQPNGQGLANVNSIFTWVRLAQRIPVRIHIDHVPEGVVLATGMTATVQIDPRPGQPAKSLGGP